MRLLPHILLAYLAIGVQRGIDPGFLRGRATVELPWVVAAFVAACVPPPVAGTAALLVGLAYDLTGDGPIGANAVGLGLGGVAVARLRPTRWTGFVGSIALVAVIAAVVTAVAGVVRGYGQTPLGGLLSAIVTVAAGAVLAWPLWKLRGRLGIADRRL